MALSHLARQSGRSSHWFFQSQMAYNLADAALREGAKELIENNGPDPLSATPTLTGPLGDLYDDLRAGAAPAAPVVLLDSSVPASLPPILQRHLADLTGFSPVFRVEARITENDPLHTAAVDGIPPDPEERVGTMRITSQATVTRRSGQRVTRTLTLERRFRVVNVLPPLLGRFVLFVHEQEAVDPNVFRVEVDPGTGRESPVDAVRPLVVRAGASGEFVAPGGAAQNPPTFTSPVSGKEFLDVQGWVYLGQGSSGPWTLNLTHGFGAFGESFQVSGYRAPVVYKGNTSLHNAFEGRVRNELSNPPGICDVDFVDLRDGLYLAHHGFADNYQVLSLDPGLLSQVQDASGTRTAVDFGPGTSSGIHLFGSPDAVSPTLVFGPVQRRYFRRAGLRVSLVDMALPGDCIRPGSTLFNLYRQPDHVPVLQTAFDAIFETQYEDHATALVEEPFAAGLNLVLDPRAGGTYGVSGLLYGMPGVGSPPAFTSAAVPDIGTLPATGGVPAAGLNKLWNGELDMAGVFQGTLDQGLIAFGKVIRDKVTFVLEPPALPVRLLVGGVLRVPGVALVDTGGGAGNPPVVLGQVDSVEAGGVLVSTSGIQISGNIRRGTTGQPLTLVAYDGDITIDPGVQRIEAYLVALNGRVRFPSGDLTIEGGVAGRFLDVESIGLAPAERSLEYDTRFDSSNPTTADPYYRVFYGMDTRLEAGG